MPRLAAAGLLAPGLLAASDRVPRLRPAQVHRFAVDLPIPRGLRPDAELVSAGTSCTATTWSMRTTR